MRRTGCRGSPEYTRRRANVPPVGTQRATASIAELLKAVEPRTADDRRALKEACAPVLVFPEHDPSLFCRFDRLCGSRNWYVIVQRLRITSSMNRTRFPP